MCVKFCKPINTGGVSMSKLGEAVLNHEQIWHRREDDENDKIDQNKGIPTDGVGELPPYASSM